jgi:hypothetical protein
MFLKGWHYDAWVRRDAGKGNFDREVTWERKLRASALKHWGIAVG